MPTGDQAPGAQNGTAKHEAQRWACVPHNNGLQLTRGAWSWGILSCRLLARRAGFGCEALVKVGPLQLNRVLGTHAGLSSATCRSRACSPHGTHRRAPRLMAMAASRRARHSRRSHRQRRKWRVAVAPGAAVLAADALSAEPGPGGQASLFAVLGAGPSGSGCFRQRQQAPERSRLALRSASRTERQRQRGVTGCKAAAGAQQGDAADEGRLELVHTPLSAVGHTGSVARRSRRLAPRS